MIPFGLEICGHLAAATQREWLEPPCPLPSLHFCIFWLCRSVQSYS